MDSIVKESYSMIDIQNVSKVIKEAYFRFLDILQHHKITILLGENGAGKSTLLRLIVLRIQMKDVFNTSINIYQDVEYVIL